MPARSSGPSALRRLLPTRAPAFRAVERTLEKLLDVDVNVLITGESGSGKDYVAESLHASSNRASRPFVRIDCASIPPDLFESELFGYKKGAFTDATSSRAGKLEAARGGTLYLDAALARMMGEEPQERYLALDEMASLVHPDDVDALRQAQSDCIKGLRPIYRIEHRLKLHGGDWVWVLSRGSVVERAGDGSAVRMIGTNVDITQRKRAEVELLSALQREKELSEMKSKFVSIASHELRTPLATILSSAELLEHYSDNLSADDRLKMLHGIQGGVKRMNAMIEDVLIIGKAEAGALQFEPKPVDLGELCRKVVEELRGGVAKQHVIQFEHQFKRSSLNLDEKLLRHILTNLLSNAAKYSPAGSVVSLLLAERDGQALIEVGDQGIGIPPEDQARMFESFHRASNVGNRQGTGLGMTIVKKAVELHGGSISIDSQVDAGTRVSVHLPLAQTARAA